MQIHFSYCDLLVPFYLSKLITCENLLSSLSQNLKEQYTFPIILLQVEVSRKTDKTKS